MDPTTVRPQPIPCARGRRGSPCWWRWGLWLLLAFGLAPLAAEAQPVFEVPAQARGVSLGQVVEYAIDDTGRWRPEAGGAPPGGWRPLSERGLSQGNFGFMPHPLWFRVTLRSPSEVERLWVVGTPQLEWVEWVLTRQGQAPERAEKGLGPTQMQGLSIHQRLPTLPLSLKAGEPLTVHMRVQSKGLMQVPIDLWEPVTWREHERRMGVLLGGYFGLLVGLLAYNGFLALRLRDRAYGYYIGFGIGLGMFQLSSTGFGPSFLWPEHALWTYTILGLMTTVFGAMSMLFTHSFLHMARISRPLSLCLRATAVGWLVALMAHLVLPAHAVMSWMSLPLALWTLLLIMASGIRGWRRGVPGATYFLLGWSGIVVSVLLRVLLRMGVLPPHPLLYDGILIASAVEMVLLSLALADRFAAERRARAESDLQRAREQAAREVAQHALQAKTRFMAAVTHDLQQPLYALNLATESVARRGAHPLPPESLAQMRSALFSADELLASLAMNVRLEDENPQPEIEDFSVQDMLERIDSLFASRAQQQGLRWRVWPSLGVVRSDSIMLERMVCNLVSNAMRYTDRGGVLLSCRARPGALLIQVWDTGPGIAEHERSVIFEAYERGSAAQARDKGLGLGLSIVRRCAQLLGIRVALRSVPGRGSCFALWVPLAPGEPTR